MKKMHNMYDIIIVGSGVAGLYAAINVSPDLKVLIISKRSLELSNSALAQGGVAAVLNHQDDSFQIHIQDTLVAGGFTNNRESLSVLVQEGPPEVLNLVKLGVDFDRDEHGKIDLTLEGGHTRHRIAHHKDTTGFEIITRLIAQVKTHANIDILDDSALLRLEKTKNGFCAGILKDLTYYNVATRFCILASGGIGQVYENTTNSKIATGDGIYFAEKLGAKIKNISLIQFHPTAFGIKEEGHERFLISESVRGEGAYLLNCDGKRFMFDYDERGELAPRDVVSNFILKEAEKTGSQKFYIDISFKPSEYIINRFPAIYEKCLELGIDMTKEKIPVFPCQHYLMGGIDVDTYARTTVEGLYAVGECSHTGVHGNNRLASNSLLEALVFSHRAVNDILEKIDTDSVLEKREFKLKSGQPVPQSIKSQVRSIMQKSFFVHPNAEEVKRNIPVLQEISQRLEKGDFAENMDTVETKSIAKIAELILREVSAR
jgi:L-aspartate oxidase